MSEKKRLDTLVFERGYTQSREKAKAVIMAGLVYADNQKADKPGAVYPADVTLEVRAGAPKYVSRGGFKLEKAIGSFGIGLKDKITMDIGASTGGFTDCMLQNGALGSLMSGSGPTVFGIFDDKDKAMAAKEKCRELPYRCFVFVTDLYR